MLFNIFGELFLNRTLLKLSGGRFGLPDSLTKIGMLLEFSQRFPAFSDSGFAVELRDWLAQEFGLKKGQAEF